jgi:class 3 adenylate cyclase
MSGQVLTLPQTKHRTHARESDHRRVRVVPVSKTERRHATIVFTDVKGSMDLSGALELDEWWSTMGALFELMCEGICRFGGWIGAFTGDGVKAVFDVPGTGTEHAEQACHAALWLGKAIEALASELRRDCGIELAIRIGINSGEILTGTIGDRYSRYYTAGGYPVALAKRIEGIAEPGHVCVSEHTAALLGERFTLRDLGAFDVKGGREPVGVFELIAGAR